ncbi:hypothetical protein DFH94DRAFT_785493, partial [Russula ochroleuca]
MPLWDFWAVFWLLCLFRCHYSDRMHWPLSLRLGVPQQRSPKRPLKRPKPLLIRARLDKRCHGMRSHTIYAFFLVYTM